MAEVKTHASPFYSPGTEGRLARRARRSAARRLIGDARAALMATRKAELAQERAERKLNEYLPAGGEPGPAALRSARRFRVQSHRATSEVLAGAYPFLAEAGLGSEGTFIGQDAWSGGAFCFDPWVLYRQGVITNPNCLLAGVVGKGKSCLARVLCKFIFCKFGFYPQLNQQNPVTNKKLSPSPINSIGYV